MTTSYWLAEAREGAPATTLDGPAEVAVVGAGVTGCSAALTLARSGVRVVVHDEREIAGGASGRSGGFALRGGAAPYDVTAAAVGRDRAQALWAATEAALDRLETVAGDAFTRVGSLRLAVDAGERDELRAEFELLREDGFAAEWADEFAPPLGDRFSGGIRHVPDGVLQPARFVRRLAAAASAAGAEFREHSRVATIEAAEAPTVIVATDGYPSGLLGPLEGLIVPTRGQVIATEPIAERWFEVPHYGRHGFDYWHQTPDGRVVAGGFRDTALASEFTAVEETTAGVQEALESFVTSLVGRTLRVDYRWAGIFGLVLDFLPVVGPVPEQDGVWVAGGYSGHGNVLGFLCGELVARAVLGDRDPLLDLCEPARLLGV